MAQKKPRGVQYNLFLSAKRAETQARILTDLKRRHKSAKPFRQLYGLEEKIAAKRAPSRNN